MNPLVSGITDGTWKVTDTVFAYNERNPAARPPGSLGDAIFFPARDGPFKETQTLVVDSSLFIKQIKEKKQENQQFEQKKGDYNQKREKYDQGVDKEQKREGDVFAKAFTPEEKLPERPSMPERPSPYNGPDLNLAKAVGANAVPWKTALKDQGNVAYLKNGNTNAPTEGFATRTSFLQSTTDQASTDPKVALLGVGHVFGVLGQGVESYPGDAKSFYWGEVKDINAPGMLVSLFPNADADAGIISAGKNVTVTARAVPWVNLGDFSSPPQPPAPQAPKKDPKAAGATSVAVGLMASLAVASYLY